MPHLFVYENRALDVWFKKAYGSEQKRQFGQEQKPQGADCHTGVRTGCAHADAEGNKVPLGCNDTLSWQLLQRLLCRCPMETSSAAPTRRCEACKEQ